MKTLQELYTEIIGSEELKKAYLEAAKGGKVVEFLKARGCEATAEEISAFLKEKSSGELSDAELDNVAGGGCNNMTLAEGFFSTGTAGIGCAVAAIYSAKAGYTGQRGEDDGRLCNLGD